MLRTWLRAALVVVGAAMAIGPARAGAEDLAELSANEAAARIRAGTLKSEDLVNALVEVIERKRDLNAFMRFDRDRVLAAARKADSLAARNEALAARPKLSQLYAETFRRTPIRAATRASPA